MVQAGTSSEDLAATLDPIEDKQQRTVSIQYCLEHCQHTQRNALEVLDVQTLFRLADDAQRIGHAKEGVSELPASVVLASGRSDAA